MEFMVPPGAMRTASHVHPYQEETYAVQEGSMEVLIDRTWFTLEVGQSATVPANTPHAFRNRSDETVRFLNEHRPALRFEEYFRAVHGLSAGGKIKGGFDVRGSTLRLRAHGGVRRHHAARADRWARGRGQGARIRGILPELQWSRSIAQR